MLAEDQVVAARGAFSLAGYDGLRTPPVDLEDERGFVLLQGLSQNPQARIPLSDWLNWSSWSPLGAHR
jgi:hypothetical protein